MSISLIPAGAVITTPTVTSVGRNALAVTTTGTDNSALGAEALRNNTGGADNSAVGSRALRNNAMGFSNVAVGTGALEANINGGNNSAVGARALAASTGFDNTALGVDALANTTTGQMNIAAGPGALQNNTAGWENCAIGNQAGNFLADGVTANIQPDRSIFIGRNTKAQGLGQTCQIVIGDDATGNGSNSTTIGGPSQTRVVLRGDVQATGNLTAPDVLWGTDNSRGIVLASGTDLNGLVISGWYDGSNLVNRPAGTSEWGHVMVSRAHSDHWVSQTYMSMHNENDIFIRRSAGVVWSPWQRLWHTGNDGPGSGLDADLVRGQSLINTEGNTLRVTTSRTPASAIAPGNVGEICWDSGFVYVCVALNTWRRASLVAW